MSPDVEIGPLHPVHRDRVREIVESTGVFRPVEVEVALEVFDAAFRTGQTDYELMGAFDTEGRLLGYVCYGPAPCAVDTWNLYWIAVAPDSQRRGVGRRLWAAVERALCAQTARLCVIDTSSRLDYEPTHQFYAGLGMVPVARIPDFYEDGDDRVIYVKRFVGSDRAGLCGGKSRVSA